MEFFHGGNMLDFLLLLFLRAEIKSTSSVKAVTSLQQHVRISGVVLVSIFQERGRRV